ncbi:MAG: hypothetical protein MZW92_49750 [Comamonadaceae bacterium]|nr:hypothetical protein [Comamonadaceae bacterium]
MTPFVRRALPARARKKRASGRPLRASQRRDLPQRRLMTRCEETCVLSRSVRGCKREARRGRAGGRREPGRRLPPSQRGTGRRSFHGRCRSESLRLPPPTSPRFLRDARSEEACEAARR